MAQPKTDPSESAFGFEGPDIIALGLTKREYFACEILANAMSIPIIDEEGMTPNGVAIQRNNWMLHRARESVRCADLLIAVLNEKP
jgi:hypothetical protein